MNSQPQNITLRTRLLVDAALAAVRRGFKGESDSLMRPTRLLQLEQRVLMSATPAAVVADAADAATAVEQAGVFADSTTGPLNSDIATNAATENPADSHADSSLPAAQSHVELVVIDPSAEHYDQLVADLQSQENRHFEILILNPRQDGISQITDALRNLSDVSAIHLVSHGEDGEILLGTSVLSQKNIARHAPELVTWQHALTADADLLIYGCDLAASADGIALTESLNVLLRADVAASDDLTGHSDLGGDWDLEVDIGSIETNVAFTTQLQSEWTSLLALNAYESFDYSAGTLEAANGGTGFANGWTRTGGTSADVISTGLTGPAGLPADQGGAAEMGTVLVFSQSRDLNTTLGADGTTVWFSFLLQPDGTTGGLSLVIGDGDGATNTVNIGTSGNDFLVGPDGNGSGSKITGAVVSGQTYFLVVQVDFAAGNDTVTLYLDPTAGVSAPDSLPAATAQLTTADLGTFTQIGLLGGFLGNNSVIDEIRVGDTFADVAGGAASSTVTARADNYTTSENSALTIAASGVLTNDTQGPPPTAGNTLGHSAADDTNGDNVWDNGTGTSGFDWDFSGGGVTYTTTPTTSLSNITAAWSFDGTGGGTANGFESIAGNPTDDPASFELWFNPTDAVGQEIIFETGGVGQGTSLSLDGSTLELLVKKGSSTALATYDLAAEIAADEFIHVIGVVDNASAIPDVYLYVNGSLVDSVMDVSGLTFWGNGDPSGLGTVNGDTETSNTSNFEGEIAVFRLYESDLPANEVLTNYHSVSQSGSSSLTATNLNTTGTIGTVALNSDGSFIYTPQAGFTGTDTFTYAATNGTNSDTATVTITVTPVPNSAPNAAGGGPYTINEGDSLTLDASSSFDPDSDPLTYKWDLDNDGDFDEAGEPTGTAPTVSWATLNSFGITNDGTYTIGLQVDDGNGGTDTATATLIVNNVAPALASSTTVSTAENTTSVQFVTATDPVDTPGFSITGGTDQARFMIDSVSGELSFIVAPDFETPSDADLNNTYLVEVTASDGDGGTIAHTVAVTVTDSNDNVPVIASGQSFSVSEAAANGTSLGTVVATDADAGTVFSNWTITGGNTDGIFAINASTGQITVVNNSNLDFETTSGYVLSLTVSDGVNTSAIGTIQINVVDQNVAPSGSNDAYTVSEGETLTVLSAVGVLSNDTDADGDTLSTSLLTNPAHAAGFTFNNDGSFTYRHDGSETLSDSFTYTVSDGTLTATATVNLTVTPVNDAPILTTASLTYNVPDQNPLTIAAPGLLAGVTDAEGDVLTVVLAIAPQHGTLNLNPDGSFAYTADNGFTGTDTFRFHVTDGVSDSGQRLVTLEVTEAFSASNPVGDTSPVVENNVTESDAETNVATEAQASQPALADSPPEAVPVGNSERQISQPTPSSDEAPGGSTQTIGLSPTVLDDVTFIADQAASISTSISGRVRASELVTLERQSTESESVAPGSGDSTEEARRPTFSYERYAELRGTVQQISGFEDSLTSEYSISDMTASTVAVAGSSIVIGSIVTALRTGLLALGFLSQLPVWTLFDPLLVMDGVSGGDDGDSLQDIIDRQPDASLPKQHDHAH
ncbi:MAG: DUF4347 domain-containing protein [Planctomycetaceae bacterium]